MGRNNRRVSANSGLLNKPDTPVKPSLSRRDKHRRRLLSKHYEAFPEEPEVEDMIILTVKPTSSVWTSIKKPGCQVSSVWYPTIHGTPDSEAFKGGEMLVKEEEQNLAVTPESVKSSSTETDTTFNFDDDEEDCYSSASSSSSSLPSPEIFRKENYVETKEELLGLDLHIKNSTLLDVSHAETIHMYHPPNLSTIIGASTILAEKDCEISDHRGPEAETKIQADSFKPDSQTQALKWNTSVKVRKSPGHLLQITNKRPILCKKKKVSFKNPIIDEKFEAKYIPATKLTMHNTSESVRISGPAEQIKPDSETSRVPAKHTEASVL
ncbi:uncharacterized protein LOC121191013 [Toxotes jaculatrix]|uniref:uncharacterized protein LOC121191013 n=1 Tax=Toxotes jaculatrix TaxID=941984 RepID=UPI001B3A934B|nr:uncharacterized protein LOC121191013 [Toxotes jaculatrix]